MATQWTSSAPYPIKAVFQEGLGEFVPLTPVLLGAQGHSSPAGRVKGQS